MKLGIFNVSPKKTVTQMGDFAELWWLRHEPYAETVVIHNTSKRILRDIRISFVNENEEKWQVELDALEPGIAREFNFIRYLQNQSTPFNGKLCMVILKTAGVQQHFCILGRQIKSLLEDL